MDPKVDAIEYARLREETQQHLESLSLLLDISTALSTGLDIDTVLRSVAERSTAALAAEGCTFLRWDGEQDALVSLLDYSADPGRWKPEGAGRVYPMDQYPLLRQPLATRQPLGVQADDARADAYETQWMAERGILSLLVVPLVVRNQGIGLFLLLRCQDRPEFVPAEVCLCQILAHEVAAALENSRLSHAAQDANQAKSEFIDFVAHELKQPMTSMQGYAKMLTMGIGGELTSMQQEFVQVINSNVDRMGKLVNDLLEISRLEAGRTKLRLATVSMRQLVEETIANSRAEIERRKHTLTVQMPDDLPPVRGDQERLVQILTNLVSNAYRYTPDGGSIEIEVGQDIGDTAMPGYVLVTISDSGIGLSPQELVQLEGKFFRSDHELVRAQPGTGLGIPITRGLVALHGGAFEIESEPGRGSTCRFTVPVAEEADCR